MNRMTTGLRALFLIVVVVSLAGASAFGLATAKKTTDGWPQFKGCSISSIAWSPDGNNIAFVVMKRSDRTLTGCLKRASIWNAKIDPKDKGVSLVKVIDLSAEDGIPCALFWTSPTEIAWAGASRNLKQGFHLYVIRLGEHKFRLLVNGDFKSCQNIVGLLDMYAPNDVYWDSKSRCLAFSSVDNRNNMQAITKVQIDSGVVKTVNVDIGVRSVRNFITFCGLPDEGKKSLDFAFIPNVSDDVNNLRGLWITDEPNPSVQTALQIVRNSNILYPRIASSGDKIAWLEFRPIADGAGFEDHVVVRDLSGIIQETPCRLVKIEDHDVVPKLGCPFAWSPDGNRIAYAYGSRIAIFTP